MSRSSVISGHLVSMTVSEGRGQQQEPEPAAAPETEDRIHHLRPGPFQTRAAETKPAAFAVPVS